MGDIFTDFDLQVNHLLIRFDTTSLGSEAVCCRAIHLIVIDI